MRSTFAVINLKNVQLPSVWNDDVLSILSPCVCECLSLCFDDRKVRVKSDSMEPLPKSTHRRTTLTSICGPVSAQFDH